MGYIFGPVPSRRLGRSLGVDLVPFKTCSYDCIYCQLGKTTCKTVERKEWVPLEELLGELKDKLATNPDYITLSGSGEPTLFSRLEVFLLSGYTAIESEVIKLNTWIEKIRPDRVQLNTVTRPPAEYFAERVLPSQMERFAGLFNPPGEIIAEFHGVAGETGFAADRKDVLEMLARRPCSMEDICDGLKLHRNQVVKYLEELMNETSVISSTLHGKKYYQAVGFK